MYFFYVILLLIALYLLLRKKPNDDFNLSKDKTLQLKGIFAICVMIGHLSFFVRGEFPYSSLYGLGLVGVNFFLFISGFGMMSSFQSNGSTYLQGFFRRRFSKLVIPFVLAVLIYFIIVAVSGGTAQAVSNLLISHPRDLDNILPFSWYVYTILVFYVCFFLIFKYIKQKSVAIFTMFVLLCLYIVGAKYFVHLYSYWYRSSFAFMVGILWAVYLDEFVHLCKKYYKVIVSIVVAIIAGLWYWGINEDSFIQNALISLIVVALLGGISFSVKGFAFLGKISYEIYLIHGIAMFINNYIFGLLAYSYHVYVLGTVITTIVLAYGLHFIVKRITSLQYFK